MSKSPIWLDETDTEIALGFIAEILAEELSNIDRKVLSDIYKQLAGNAGHEPEDNHYLVEIETTTKHRLYIFAPDRETAQVQAYTAVIKTFQTEQAPTGKVWAHYSDSNFDPKSIVSSIHEIQG
jgi:hypothetical protein